MSIVTAPSIHHDMRNKSEGERENVASYSAQPLPTMAYTLLVISGLCLWPNQMTLSVANETANETAMMPLAVTDSQ